MSIFKTIVKWIFRTLLTMTGLFLIAATWFYFAVRISTPTPSSREVLKLERKTAGKDFYTINNNWLKKSETGLWEMYVEGDGFERGVIEGKLNKGIHFNVRIA